MLGAHGRSNNAVPQWQPLSSPTQYGSGVVTHADNRPIFGTPKLVAQIKTRMRDTFNPLDASDVALRKLNDVSTQGHAKLEDLQLRYRDVQDRLKKKYDQNPNASLVNETKEMMELKRQIKRAEVTVHVFTQSTETLMERINDVEIYDTLDAVNIALRSVSRKVANGKDYGGIIDTADEHLEERDERSQEFMDGFESLSNRPGNDELQASVDEDIAHLLNSDIGSETASTGMEYGDSAGLSVSPAVDILMFPTTPTTALPSLASSQLDDSAAWLASG